MRRTTWFILLAFGFFIGAMLALLVWPSPADAQPPGIGDSWAANGWTTWTCLRDSLPTAGYDSTYCKQVTIATNQATTGGGVAMSVGDPSGPATAARTLLKFDVSFIPSTHEIERAVLGLYGVAPTGLVDGTTYYIEAYRVLKTWYETGTDSMWTQCREGVNEAGTGINWSSVGCSTDSVYWGSPRSATDSWDVTMYSSAGTDTLTGTDYTAADREAPPRRGPYVYRSAYSGANPVFIDVTQFVTLWHNGIDNQGMLLMCSALEAATKNIQFGGVNAAVKRQRPVLWIATREITTGGTKTLGKSDYGRH